MARTICESFLFRKSILKSHERELLIYRILAGYIRAEIEDKCGHKHKLLICNPTIHQSLIAQEIYNETYAESLTEGLFDDDQYLVHIVKRGLWTLEEEKRLEELPKEMEDLKLSMFDNLIRSVTRENLRKKLKNSKEECAYLFGKKYRLNYLTAEGMAGLAKNYYLAGQCVKKYDFSSFFIDYDEPNYILEEIIEVKNKNNLKEDVFRELARTDPWRTYWGCGEVFGTCARDMTDEQRKLSATSKLFDNIMECPECPALWILEDDDLLDGWLIRQRKKREDSLMAAEAEAQVSDKVSRADMIFIPVETAEDNKRVEALNSPMAKMLKQKRLNVMQDKGAVSDEEFTDVRLKMMGLMK